MHRQVAAHPARHAAGQLPEHAQVAEQAWPLQDKIFKYVQREISEMDESEGWKLDEEQEEEGRDDAWPV
jgi:hypothetical protein